MSEKFTIRYSVADGYVGKDRPHSFKFSAGELEYGLTDDDLRNYYEEAVNDHFQQNIFPEGSNEDEFVEWAKEQIAKIDHD